MTGETTRARLHVLLAEACELEHALCCSYLYAAFSIARDIADGLDWRRQQIARKWASQIYHVAAQEMLHLAQAWNILTATGGAPYYARPAFPQPARHFPLNVALTLRRFDRATLDRFLIYENPGDVPIDEAARRQPGLIWPIDEHHEYRHVGELYGEIARIILAIDETALFVDDRQSQRGQPLVDFYDIIEVHDRASAIRAIEIIVHQGEGSAAARTDSHFGVFRSIAAALRADGHDYAHPVADNPYLAATLTTELVATRDRLAEAGVDTTEIIDPPAVHAIDLFNDVYLVMLQAMAHLFVSRDAPADYLQSLSRSALELMVTVIKPLGEGICRMPSGHPGRNAGPSFLLPRHVDFPQTASAAAPVYHDRLRQLAAHGALLLEMADTAPAPRHQLAGAVANLRRIAGEFGAAMQSGRWRKQP